MNRAEELIADLEAEIVKRDARIAEMKREFLKLASMTASTPLVIEQQRGGVVLPEREEFDKWFRHEQLISESIDTTWISESFLPYRAWMARSRLNPLRESVVVPRELLERAALHLSEGRLDGPAACELRALLAQQGKAVGDE